MGGSLPYIIQKGLKQVDACLWILYANRMLCDQCLAQSVFSWATLMEFLSLQEGLLCCSVESLYVTICLGMICTLDVMSNVGQLIEFLTDLKTKLQFLFIHEITFIKILGHTRDNIYENSWADTIMRYMY